MRGYGIGEREEWRERERKEEPGVYVYVSVREQSGGVEATGYSDHSST